jgi:hypothetical protein
MRRTGKRWLIAVIKKTWEIAWSLWQHRNKVQEIVRDAKIRQTLKDQTVVIFAKGLSSVHFASRRLFTHKTMEERLKQRTSDLQAWVRRIQLAQARTYADPVQAVAQAAAKVVRVRRAQKAAAKYARRRSRFPSLPVRTLASFEH